MLVTEPENNENCFTDQGNSAHYCLYPPEACVQRVIWFQAIDEE